MRRSTSTPSTASRSGWPAGSWARSRSCPASRPSSGVPSTAWTTAKSVPFIGAPVAWQDYGAAGNGADDRGHRHRHRLHPREFGGPGTVRRTTTTTARSSRTARSRPRRSSAAGTSRATTTTPTGGRRLRDPRPDPIHSTATATAGTSPARRPGRREGRPHHLHRCLRRRPPTTTSSASARASRPGGADRAQGLRLRRPHRLLDRALEWAAEYNATHADPLDVVNMSLGGVGGDDAADARPPTRSSHPAYRRDVRRQRGTERVS